jgi:hypothetical protein
LIAILVGVLLQEIDEDWDLAPVKTEEDALSNGKPLRSSRNTYESLILRNTATSDSLGATVPRNTSSGSDFLWG